MAVIRGPYLGRLRRSLYQSEARWKSGKKSWAPEPHTAARDCLFFKQLGPTADFDNKCHYAVAVKVHLYSNSDKCINVDQF